MKKYLKILGITASIQLAGFILMCVLESENFSLGMFPVHIFLASIVVSTLLGIILPICWFKSKGKKLAGIFLLPTNYTWLVVIVVCKIVVMKAFEILWMILQGVRYIG